VRVVEFVDIEELYKAATKLKDSKRSLTAIPKVYQQMFQDMQNLMQSIVVDGIKDWGLAKS
jgi:serine/threonine-protein kinase RIO1